jgi:tRNA modification GTPase
MRDTIFAPATAAGRAAVAVVRISGPQSSSIATALCRSLPAPRRASLRRLQSGDGVLDEALVLWMPGPDSFTGEDCVELHLHGGSAVVEAVSAALAEAGARLAAAGEFTRRAFEAGRLDLTQAEAVADLIDAETQAQRRQATAQLSGALSNRYQAWRDRLFDALALIEAGIDFPEEDIPGGLVSGASSLIQAVADEVREELADSGGERVRDGVRIALIGAPNVGKSSVFNALVGRDAAIVTPMAGTTRDIVEASMVLSGFVVRLADTAGLREAMDGIEAEGIRRAQLWADEADIRLVISDASRPDTIRQAEGLMRAADILVVNKTDLADPIYAWPGAVVTSAIGGLIDSLREVLEAHVATFGSGRDFPAITRQRHRDLLADCLDHLDRGLSQTGGAELVGEDIRLAVRSLERVTGRSDPEAVLDRVFANFCIGK